MSGTFWLFSQNLFYKSEMFIGKQTKKKQNLWKTELLFLWNVYTKTHLKFKAYIAQTIEKFLYKKKRDIIPQS